MLNSSLELSWANFLGELLGELLSEFFLMPLGVPFYRIATSPFLESTSSVTCLESSMHISSDTRSNLDTAVLISHWE